ncbi:hypothetical protein [Sphaerisporangium sp. NPDC051011]|uniref:hypothetical protein n=1 Tax=Sphaerisporangium sp. NPDC051011 TaxID=3155792 RepID=UPI0033E73046
MTKRSYTSAASIPDDETAPKLPQFDFELDGVTFVCTEAPSALDLSEFARLAAEGVDSESPEGLAILAQVFITVLGEKEYRRFRAHCRKYRPEPELLIQIIGDIFEDYAERPTTRPSDSPDGPPTTGATSKVVSLSQATVRVVDGPEPETRTVPAGRVVSYG